LALAGALAGNTAHSAENPLGLDPVYNLRQALQAPLPHGSASAVDLNARRQSLQECLAALCSLPELREVLLLDGWRNDDADESLAAIDRAVRLDLARRFEHALREVLQRGDPTGQVAAANMLCEAGPALQGLHLPGWEPAAFGGVLAELVRGNDPGVRGAAARALGQIHADPVVALTAFQNLYQDRDPALRRVAISGLTGLASSIPERLPRSTGAARNKPSAESLAVLRAVLPVASAGLSDADPAVRRLSMDALRQTALTATRFVDAPRLIPAARAEEAALYCQQVETERTELGPLARDLKDLTVSLAPLLGDRDPAARLFAHQTVEALSAVWRRLQDRAASAALTRQAPATATPAPTLLPALATEAQPLAVRSADRWLILLPLLAWGASDPDVQVRRAAVETLETVGEDAAPAAHALVCALGDADVFVRWGAARTLGQIGSVPGVAVVPGLIPLLSDPDADVRVAAAEALGSFGRAAREAVPALTEALRLGTPTLRLAAVQALAGIGLPSQAAIPALATALKTPDVRVRLAAARLLGKFGPAALESKESLGDALQDPDAEVRQAVSDALLQILPPPGRSAASVENRASVSNPGETKVLPVSYSPPMKRRTLFAEDR
jgi:HEAT repeat protein